MRNYFDFKLKGSQIFLYVLVAWAVLIAVSLIISLPNISMALSGEYIAPDERLLDGNFIWNVLTSAGLSLLQLIVSYGVMFFIVKATVDGLSLGEDRFRAEYDFGQYVWLVVKGAFFTIITLGIYFPWFLARLIRYFAQNTSFRAGMLNFKGKGLTLFGIIVLTMVLPIFLAMMGFIGLGFAAYNLDGPSMEILWVFLILFVFIFIMALSRALMLKWFFDFSYGSKRITSEVKVVPAAFFIIGQALLVMITLGFYLPMYMLRMYRYFVSRMVLGDDIVEDRFGFTLNVWKDYFYVLGQGLLTIITLGIYWSWAYARVMTRLFTHSYVETVEERKIPMPRE